MNKNKTNSYSYLVIVMGLLSAFGPFVTDFYIPAFPALAKYFTTSPSLVQASLATSIIGLAVGQLLIGPLSDKYGRKPPLLISLLLFLLATCICLFSPSIQLFILARLCQGFAAAGGIVIARSVGADLFTGRQLTRFFAMLMVVVAIAPVIAPVFGGFLLTLTDWRGMFWTLLAIGLLLFALNLYLRESLPLEKRRQCSVLSTFSSFLPIFKNRKFLLFVLTQSSAMGVFFAYISSSPFIFQELYNISAFSFSLFFGLNACAIMLSSRLTLLVREQTALRFASLAMVLITVLLAGLLVTNAPLLMIEGGLFLMMFTLGFILPTSASLALQGIEENKGSASAILGFFLFFTGSIISPLVGLGNICISTALALIFCGLLTGSFALLALTGSFQQLSSSTNLPDELADY